MASAKNPFDVSLLKRQVGPDASKHLDGHARVAEEVRALVTGKNFSVAKAARRVSDRRNMAAGANNKKARLRPETAEKHYRKFFTTKDNIYRKGAIKEVVALPAWMDEKDVAEMIRDGEDQRIKMFVLQTGIKVARLRWIKRPLLLRRHSSNPRRPRSRP